MAMKWYAIGTFSGYESRAKQLLEENIKNHGLEERFGEILVPTEEVIELRGGAKRTMQKKLMPGYIFVQMDLDGDTWSLVKNTQRVTGFIGDDKHPKPISQREINKLTQKAEEGAAAPSARVAFEEGNSVRIIDGPFLNFSGTVEEVMPQKQKVRVLVSIFGRATPVELDFMQVEKL
ncbi:MAG: transcription termination/antitermination protein NusG [Myxococcota bacterium]